MVDLYRQNVKTIFSFVRQSSWRFKGIYLIVVSPAAFCKLFLMKNRRGGLGPYFDLNYSVRKKIVFIHIPKAAGRSVRDAIMEGRSASHLSANIIRLALGNSLYENCFSFAFTRHPYDRFESAFYFLRAGGVSRRDRRYKKRYFDQDLNINEFVEEVLNEKIIFDIIHFRPQVEFLEIDGEIGVDFLGKYENLQQDFAELIRKFSKENVLLPWNNKTDELGSKDVDSKRYSLNDVSKDKLFRLYREDFIKLGYER